MTPRGYFTRSLRLTGLLLWLGCGGLAALGFGLISRPRQRRIMQRWFQVLLQLVGVRLEVEADARSTDGRVLVANHLSWLDIVALNAWQPCCFIAKSEIRRWPLIGWLSARAGTLFIERQRRRATVATNRQLQAAVAAGEWLVFFPEGQVGNGQQLLPFHAALFAPVAEDGLPLHAIALQYHSHHGERCTTASFHDVSLLASVWRLLGERGVAARLYCSPPFATHNRSRKILAQETWHWIFDQGYAPKECGSRTAGPSQGS